MFFGILVIYIIFSNFRDFLWHSFIAYTVCTIFEILTHCKIQQTDLKPQQRWESPMKWKYDHIWIDWFLLGVRPHKQNTMGCQQQQWYHHREAKIEKLQIRQFFVCLASWIPTCKFFWEKTEFLCEKNLIIILY